MKTIVLLLLLTCFTAFGAGKKTTDYPPITNAGPNDLLLLSEFAGGVTNSKSISISNLNNSLLALPKNGPYLLSDTGSGTNTTLSKGIIFDYLSFGSGAYLTNTAENLQRTLSLTGTNAVATLGQVSNIVAAATNGLSSGGGGDTLTNIAGASINVSTNGGYRVFTATNTYQSGLFGDGSDGFLNFDGVTTPVGGATLSGGIYTQTRTLYASSIQVTSAVTLRVTGWRILCTGILTNLGTIQALANVGGNGAASGTNGAIGAGVSANEIGGSIAGAIGGLGSATTGGNSASGGNSATSSGGAAAKGGRGGAGLGGANAGGISATVGTLTARPFRTAPSSFLISGITLVTGGTSGSGGGAGGGDAVVFGGGGGGSGAGGGVCAIWAWGITNNGTISVNGGDGGAGGSPASGNAGGGAGGGGGGGGFVYANAAYYSGSGTWTATGGTGGTGGTAQGTGVNGSPGTNGAAGLVIRYNVTTRAFE